MTPVDEQLKEIRDYVQFLEEQVARLKQRLEESQADNAAIVQKYLLERTYQ